MKHIRRFTFRKVQSNLILRYSFHFQYQGFDKTSEINWLSLRYQQQKKRRSKKTYRKRVLGIHITMVNIRNQLIYFIFFDHKTFHLMRFLKEVLWQFVMNQNNYFTDLCYFEPRRKAKHIRWTSSTGTRVASFAIQ